MNDLRDKLTALLDTAAQDGGQVIAIAAVRQLIDGEPQSEWHILRWYGEGKSWIIRHPAHCDPTNGCDVYEAAKRTLTDARYQPGSYLASVGESGFLIARPAVHA